MGSISLTIDGRTVEVEEGGTVLQAARLAGIDIPTICDHKDLTPFGACRMCVVEIEGVRGYPTSCTTPATQGMRVTTQSKRLTTLRNCTLELMFSGHPNSCLVCPHREACERERPRATKAARSTRCGFCANRDECSLRALALKANCRELSLPTIYAAHKLERDDPFMDRDYNLCVLCGRCWRICEKIHGKPAISIVNRGKWARIGTAFDTSHLYSGCTFCGACIDICPTGTLTDRFARWQGKPDRETPTACLLCSEGCSLLAQSKNSQLLACTMIGYDRADSLCALGRFGTAQLVNAGERLIRPLIREGEDLIPTDWEAAIKAAAEGVRDHAGRIALVISAATSREDRYLYRQLSEHLRGSLLILPTSAGSDDSRLEQLAAAIDRGEIRAVVTDGDLLPKSVFQAVAFSLVIDCLPSVGTTLASVVLPVAILSEVEGTLRTAAGVVKDMTASTSPPGQARPEWRILTELGQTLGLEWEDDTVTAVTGRIADDPTPELFAGNPRHNVRTLPIRFRGHLVADIVPALAAFGLPTTVMPPATEETGEGFELISRHEIAPNMHQLTIRAPQVARFAQPGQFVILMATETSERSPFTLVDWDEATGTITLVIEEVGRSSRQLVSVKPGSRIAHVSGPLGLPLPIERKGTILLGGGCYGIGAIYPLARALRAAGNRVLCAIEASSAYLLYMEEQLRTACDELLIATKDGSRGLHGGIQEVVAQTAARERIDQCIAIGCTFMMRMVTETTRALSLPTLVALNPIMVDGTGMCGACRVSIGEQTRFACVDGPIFDGHAVDWDELASRRSAYARQEVQALAQGVDLSALLYQPEPVR